MALNTCNGCGSAVSVGFARVFGDNDNEVFGCVNCLTSTNIRDGSTGVQ